VFRALRADVAPWASSDDKQDLWDSEDIIKVTDALQVRTFHSAVSAYERALDAVPNHTRARRGLARLYWGRLGAAGQYLGDPDLRQVLAVAHGAAVMLAPLLLEDLDLVAARLLDEFGRHHGAGNDRGSDLDPGLVDDHEHLVELENVTGLARQPLDLENIVGLDAVLLAARLDDCVHIGPSVFNRAHRRRGVSPADIVTLSDDLRQRHWRKSRIRGSVAGAEYTANRLHVKETPHPLSLSGLSRQSMIDW
jgi:hypothetical protein